MAQDEDGDVVVGFDTEPRPQLSAQLTEQFSVHRSRRDDRVHQMGEVLAVADERIEIAKTFDDDALRLVGIEEGVVLQRSSTTSTSASSTPPAKSCVHSPSTPPRTTKEQADQSAVHHDPTDPKNANGPNPKTQVQTVVDVALDDTSGGGRI